MQGDNLSKDAATGHPSFSSIEDVIADISAGKMVIIVDD